MMRRIALILLLALIFSGILSFDIKSKVLGDGGDNFEFFGFQYITGQNLAHLKHPFARSDILRYPEGFEYSFGQDGAFAVLTGALLGLVTGQTAAYNLSVFAIVFVNLWVSLFFFEKLARDKNSLMPFISAIIFALSPYVLARINSHLNLAFVAGFPLAGIGLLNILEEHKKGERLSSRSLVLAGAGILVIAAGSLQYLILLLENIIALGFILYFTGRTHLESLLKTIISILKRNFKKILTIGAIFGLIFMFFFGGYVWGLITNKLVFVDKAEELALCCQPGLIDTIIPNSYVGGAWTLLNGSSASIEKVVTIGIVGIALLLYFIAANRRSWENRFAGWWVVIYLAVTLQFLPLPGIPEAGREIVILSFVLSALFAARLKLSPKITGLILIVLLAERLTFTPRVTDVFPTNLSKFIKSLPGKSVINVPLSEDKPLYSALPYFYGKKIADGYFHYTADTPESKTFLTDRRITPLICSGEKGAVRVPADADAASTLELLKSHDIRTLVLFKKSEFLFDECANVREFFYNLAPPALTLKEESTDVAVWHEELDDRRSLRTEIFFARGGELKLFGLLLSPERLSDLVIKLPDGIEIKPNFISVKDGVNTDLAEVKILKVAPGSRIVFYSDQDIRQPMYFTLWYNFKPDKSGSTAKPAVERVYKNEGIEVYKLN